MAFEPIEYGGGVKHTSESKTFDGTGRAVIAKPINKLLNVSVDSSSYIVYPRYLDGSQTILYLRVPDALNTAVTSQPTLTVSYYYYED